MTELALNPAPILLVHRAPARDPGDRAPRDRPPARPTTSWTGTSSGTGSGRSGPTALGAIDEALAQSQALIADGHHRYAAYLRMQRRSRGGLTDRGLAMLVDQEDTPLFLGPIHRILTGVSLDDLAAAAEVVGRQPRAGRPPRRRARAGPGHAGRDRWATMGDAQAAAARDRAAVELLHEDVVPALPRGPQRIEYHHSVEATLNRLRTRTAWRC